MSRTRQRCCGDASPVVVRLHCCFCDLCHCCGRILHTLTVDAALPAMTRLCACICAAGTCILVVVLPTGGWCAVMDDVAAALAGMQAERLPTATAINDRVWASLDVHFGGGRNAADAARIAAQAAAMEGVAPGLVSDRAVSACGCPLVCATSDSV
jgi:hypothetical protein